ncbi:MAG: helix-turn-helix domain-containing protein [Candidatus Wildermuthbacteria bacterium]|nr:helix-turn-helix domain-containing protein [Candidatus Wildermuthbacteria bacterium]
MADPIKQDQLYTTQETREFLRISERTLKRFLKSGMIRAHKVGGQYRIWGKEILKLVSPGVEEEVAKIYHRLKEKTKEKIRNW